MAHSTNHRNTAQPPPSRGAGRGSAPIAEAAGNSPEAAPVRGRPAWRPALRWAGLVVAAIGIALFVFGLGQPSLAGCEGRIIDGGTGPDWNPSATQVTACGDLVYEGSRDAAEEYLQRAQSDPATWPFTIGAAILLGAGAVLIAVGNIGPPARRRITVAQRVGLAVIGVPIGFAAGIVTVVGFRRLYLSGWVGYGNEAESFVVPLLLIPAYVILGVVFGAAYRPVARAPVAPETATRAVAAQGSPAPDATAQPTAAQPLPLTTAEPDRPAPDEEEAPAVTNGLAVAGLVCSLIGLAGALVLGALSALLLSLPGLVLGLLGATKSPALPKGRTMAWWAVGLGAAGVLVSALPYAFLL